MSSGYPGSLDSLATNKVDGTATAGDHAQHHDDLADAVNKIEAELGTNPRGVSISVKERFNELDQKQVVDLASTTNVSGTYNNGTAGVGATKAVGGASLSVDGTNVTNGMRVLLKDQTTAYENGLYDVSGVGSSVLLTRSIDADTATKIADFEVPVSGGALNGDSKWKQVATGITVGTTAIQFRRAIPFYGLGNPRNPWAAGALSAQPIMETLVRQHADGIYTHPVTGALQTLVGGITIPAGRPVTNVNAYVYAAGANPTVSWFGLVRQSDRVVLAHTTNITTAPGSANAVWTRALSSVFTSNYDVPVWIMLSYVNATTAMTLAGGQIPATPATVAAFRLAAPAMFATNGVTPTTTMPTDGTTTVTAASAGSQLSMPYFWLT